MEMFENQLLLNFVVMEIQKGDIVHALLVYVVYVVMPYASSIS